MLKEKLRNALYKFSITRTICEKRIRIHEWFLYVWPIYVKKIKKPKSIFLVLTPTHGNIGDQAIAFAEEKMLNKLNIPYIEVTDMELSKLKDNKFLSSMNGTTILFNGGGYLGTLWLSSENLLRDVIVNNKQSKIILFPNTIFYEKNEFGDEELKKSVEIYNNHPNLKIFARELTSYNFMKDVYKNVELVPDIVLSLDSMDYNFERQGCLLCLRNDCEKTLCDDSYKNILDIAHEKFSDKVFMTDMCVNYSISTENRENEVIKKMKEFSKAQLVITDRLHCMIFCALTNTPCIVVNSKSPKIKGCYKWIEKLEYIKMIDDLNYLEDDICQVMNCKDKEMSVNLDYSKLIKTLMEL